MYIYIIIAYLLRVYIYAQIIFISSIFVRLFVHHHLKHIFMNHSYCFDETPLGQVTQVTRRYCRTWRLTPFSSSAVRLGDDENFPNIFLEFQILVRKNINPRSRVNILQNILENILENIFIYTRKLQRRTFISVVIIILLLKHMILFICKVTTCINKYTFTTYVSLPLLVVILWICMYILLRFFREPYISNFIPHGQR